MKSNWKKVIISSLIILLPAVFGLVFWNKLPELMPMHWGFDGSVDSFGPRAFMVLGLPGILLGIHWLCLVLDRSHKEQGKKVQTIVFWIIPIISVFVCGMTYALALGLTINAFILLPLLLGVLFIVLGNYMPKTKRNRTFGIKLRWTLGNDDNWNKTHRFTGKLWVAGGFLILFTVFLPMEFVVGAIAPSLLIMIIVPMVYSYRLYRTHKKQGVEYKARPASKGEKTAIRITLIVVPVLLAAVAVLMFTGNVCLRLEKDYFQIESTYWSDMKVDYDSVDSIELRQEMVSGIRTYGFGSARLSLGSYENQEFGRYTRYTYAGNDACIVLRSGDKVLVICGRDDLQTEQWYRQLLDRIS